MEGPKFVLVLSLISSIILGTIGDPTPEQRLLAEVYTNFSNGVVDALAKDDSAIPPPPPGPAAADPDVNTMTSLFGLTHILAVIHEKFMPVAVPVFESLLATTPKNLPESYNLIASTSDSDPDIKISSLIFTSEKLELTSGLSKLRTELVNVDLKGANAVSTINGQLAKKIPTPLSETFIPKDSVLSPSAVAILTDTLTMTEAWSVPVKKISGAKFNGKETVDMVEFSGNLQVIESDKAVEVFIPFKNPKRAISLVLPYDVASIAKGDFGDMKPMNYTSVRIQLPLFKVAIRQPQASLASTTKCEFKKDVNFLHLFEELAFVSLDMEKFEAISISGAQITNVAEFKKELAKGNKAKAIDVAPPVENGLAPPVEKPKTILPVGPGAEKLIVFDKPYSWSVLDENLGPLFSGSTETFVVPKDPATQPKPGGPTVFGFDTSLPFEKCL